MAGFSLTSARVAPLQAGAWLARAAVLVAAAWCLWMLVQLAWSLLTPVSPGPVTGSGSSNLVRKTADTAGAIDISSWHLFGNGHSNELQKQIMQDAQASTLKLSLHGTVAERGDTTGYALIADASGTEHSYRVGDSIQSGVTLRAVYANHILLDNHGRNERLDLPRETLHAARGLPSGQAMVGSSAAAGTEGATAPATPLYVTPNIASGRVDWQRMQSEMRDDPAAVVASLGIQPVFDGSQMRGVRLAGAANNPLIAAAGLRSNDVVTAVNGVRLDSLARGQQLFDQLRDARHVTLTILRNGQPETLSVDVPAQP